MKQKEKIQKAYVEYLLENEKKPRSVYILAKHLKIAEAEVYEHFSSLSAIDRSIWGDFIAETLKRVESEEVYASYSVREKMLAFYFTLIEVLKAKRSYVLVSFEHKRRADLNPAFLQLFKANFQDYAQSLVLEGLETQEIAERPYITDTYPRLLWGQVYSVIRFWTKDHSAAFENTDVFIEKAVNFAFDGMGKTPIDSAFDLLKFAWQNR